jgi:hypothetical protein
MNLFGEKVGAGSKPAPVVKRMNRFGKIVEDTWFDLPNHNPGINLGEFSILPDNTHGIIWIIENGETGKIVIGRI